MRGFTFGLGLLAPSHITDNFSQETSNSLPLWVSLLIIDACYSVFSYLLASR
jgi:hypothetical protein